MTRVTQAQKNRLQRQLRERERFLYADIGRELAKDDRDYAQVAGEAPDAGDQATATLVADLDHAEIGRDIREIREIGSALRRIQAPDYGVCIDCQADIPYRRLQAQPTAVRCSRCQARYERHHAGQGRGPTL